MKETNFDTFPKQGRLIEVVQMAKLLNNVTTLSFDMNWILVILRKQHIGYYSAIFLTVIANVRFFGNRAETMHACALKVGKSKDRRPEVMPSKF